MYKRDPNCFVKNQTSRNHTAEEGKTLITFICYFAKNFRRMYKATKCWWNIQKCKNFGIIVCPISFVSDKIKHESSAMQTKSKKRVDGSSKMKKTNSTKTYVNMCIYDGNYCILLIQSVRTFWNILIQTDT